MKIWKLTLNTLRGMSFENTIGWLTYRNGFKIRKGNDGAIQLEAAYAKIPNYGVRDLKVCSHSLRVEIVNW